MASIRLKYTKKNGSSVYEIRSTKSRTGGQKSISWVAPSGWSKKAIDRELKKVSAELDRMVKEGEILTKTEAREKAEAELHAEAQILTVRQYGEGVYIPYKLTECAARTVEYYESMLNRYIYPSIGDIKITKVRAVDLKHIIVNAQAKGLGFSTVRGIYLTLSQMFNQADKDDAIELNPMSKVDAPRRKKDEPKKQIEAFTDEQLAILGECLEKEPLKWKTFFYLLMDTGIRKGEACGLRWDSIDFNSGWITIGTNVVRVAGSGTTYVEVVAPKSGKTRRVIVSRRTLSLLEEMKEQSGQYEFVFVQRGEDGRPCALPMVPNSADNYLRVFTKKYGIDFKCNPHKFRHTAATKAIASGASIPAVSRMLGHAQISTTMNFYVHPDDKDVEEAYNILQTAIGRSPSDIYPRKIPDGHEKTERKMIVNDK